MTPMVIKMLSFYGFSISDAQLFRGILSHSNSFISGVFFVPPTSRRSTRTSYRMPPGAVITNLKYTAMFLNGHSKYYHLVGFQSLTLSFSGKCCPILIHSFPVCFFCSDTLSENKLKSMTRRY